VSIGNDDIDGQGSFSDLVDQTKPFKIPVGAADAPQKNQQISISGGFGLTVLKNGNGDLRFGDAGDGETGNCQQQQDSVEQHQILLIKGGFR